MTVTHGVRLTCMVSFMLPQTRAAISGCDETNVSIIEEKSLTEQRILLKRVAILRPLLVSP